MIARLKLVEPRNIFRQVVADQAPAEVVSIAPALRRASRTSGATEGRPPAWPLQTLQNKGSQVPPKPCSRLY
jgi:hypothetical protein